MLWCSSSPYIRLHLKVRLRSEHGRKNHILLQEDGEGCLLVEWQTRLPIFEMLPLHHSHISRHKANDVYM